MSNTSSTSGRPGSLFSSLWHGLRLFLVAAAPTAAIFGFLFLLDLVPPPRRSEGQQTLATTFDLTKSIIDVRKIRGGGPPKDGIPAIDTPKFLAVEQAGDLQAGERVVGVVLHDEARAYPLSILNLHEIVNDRFAQTPVAVTYCPLCDSVAVFDRRTPLGEREFGVSGLLYNSNVLMYDRGGKPESLWSQVLTTGITGPGGKKSLTALPCELTTWGAWKARYPKTQVLSTETGHSRDYRQNPYADYFTNQQLMFPAEPVSNRFPNKERVLGAWVGTQFRAYPESSFSAERTQLRDTLGGKRITVEYDAQARSLRVAEADEGVSWLYSFWFAWYALHPETTVAGKATVTERGE